MEMAFKILGNILAMLITSLISANIATAGWLGVINSLLASTTVYLIGSYLEKRAENLEETTKKFLKLLSEILISTSYAVILLGSVYAWALANQPVDSNNFSEANRVIVNERQIHDIL